MKQNLSLIKAVILCAPLMFLPEIASAGAGAQWLRSFIEIRILNEAIIAFEGIAFLMLFYYGFRLVITSYQGESAQSEASNSFIYASVGFAILAMTQALVNALGTGINPAPIITALDSVEEFLIRGASVVFSLMLTITGIRMLTTQGESGDFTKQRGILISNAIGLALTLIADPIVVAISGGSPQAIINEMVGIAYFMLTLIGAISVAALIVSGMYLIISVDESYKDRAKKTIIGTLFTLGLVIASWTLLITFV